MTIIKDNVFYLVYIIKSYISYMLIGSEIRTLLSQYENEYSRQEKQVVGVGYIKSWA